MLSRLRYLGAGAAVGIALSKAAKMLEEDDNVLQKLMPTKMAAGGEPVKTIAVVKMSGVIAAPSPGPFPSKNISLENFDKTLTDAFLTPNCAAVVIEMNSPGGSPVQSALLHNRLRALREEHPGTPLLCFCTDVCASGGYYIASACDEIHCMPSSIVGSIGVVSPSLGLTGLMKQYGVEDRTMTAGTSKAADSPLRPRDPVADAKKQKLLDELHHDFASTVTAARGPKLKHAEAAAYARRCGDKKGRKERQTALFDGSVWAGRTAVQFGLADGLYEEMNAALKRRYGKDTRIREVKKKAGLMEKLSALQEQGMAAHAAALVREAGGEFARAAEARQDVLVR